MMMNRFWLTAFLYAIALSGFPQMTSLDIKLEVNDEDGILLDKNTLQAFLLVENREENKIDFTIEWKILTDDWRPLKTIELTYSINPKQTLRTDCPLFRFPDHGFYRIQARVTTSNSQVDNLEQVIGIDPEKLIAPLDRKEDFEQFWQGALTELSGVKPDYRITPVSVDSDRHSNLFKVEMKSYQNKTVRGWLEVPKNKGVYPALLRVPGYQENMTPIDIADNRLCSPLIHVITEKVMILRAEEAGICGFVDLTPEIITTTRGCFWIA